jgi:hypothetical protein
LATKNRSAAVVRRGVAQVFEPPAAGANGHAANGAAEGQQNILGFWVRDVLLALDKEGWTTAQARKLLDKLGVPAANYTIASRLSQGRRGYTGAAPLTRKQLRQLERLRDG